MFLKIIYTLALIVASGRTQEANTENEKNQTRSQRAAVVGAGYSTGYAPDGGYSYEKPAIAFGANQNLGVSYSAVGYNGAKSGGINGYAGGYGAGGVSTYNVGVGYPGPKGVDSVGYNGVNGLGAVGYTAAKGAAGFGGTSGYGVRYAGGYGVGGASTFNVGVGYPGPKGVASVGYNGVNGLGAVGYTAAKGAAGFGAFGTTGVGLNTAGVGYSTGGVNNLNIGYTGAKGPNTYGSSVNSYNVGTTGIANSYNLGAKNLGYNDLTRTAGVGYNNVQGTIAGINSFGGQYRAVSGAGGFGFNALNCHQNGHATQYGTPQYYSQYNVPSQQNYFGQIRSNYPGQQALPNKPGFTGQYKVATQSYYNQFNAPKQSFFAGQYGAPKQQGYLGQYDIGKQNYYTQLGGFKQQNYFTQYDTTRQNFNGISNTIKPHKEYGVPDGYRYPAAKA